MTTPNNTIKRAKVHIGRAFGALFIGICLTAIALAVVLPRGSSAATAVTLGTAADSYVEGGSATTNFGGDAELEIKDSSDIGNDRHAFLKFDLRGVSSASVGSAVLKLYVTQLPNGTPAPAKLFAVNADSWTESAIIWNNQPAQGALLGSQSLATTGWVNFDITAFVNAQLAGDKLVTVELLDDTLARLMIRFSSREGTNPPALVLDGAAGPPAATATQPPAPTATKPPAVTATNLPAPTATKPPATTPTATQPPAPPPPTGGAKGIWISAAELAQLPMSGPAWQQLKAAADDSLGSPNIADQNSDHDVNTLAVALVYARTGNASYRAKAANAILSAIGTEAGGRTLALGRNLVAYIIAADLIDLKSYNAAGDQQFRAWLSAVRKANLDGKTLISTHEGRPNNWGTHAGASRVAADMYLGDTADLTRAATVFKGWLGDRAAYAGFDYGDTSWQADPSKPVGVNPAGAAKSGHVIDGALPDDMRRGCSFTWAPCPTVYPWEAMQGATVQARLLSRAGYDVWNWQNRAMLRATQFLYNLNQEVGGWWAQSDDEWQPWIINKAYGSNFPAVSPAGTGKNMGWTDWTFGR
ncbi:MAG: DNRLRE domain-containing protein [Roseiflexaceae bacterium]